jgi:hypothetical protein
LSLSLVFAATLFLFCVPSAISAPAAARFEVPGVQTASEVLPPQLIAGPHYRVRDEVGFYGYMRNYAVDSDYGVFQVTGDFALRKLIKEIGAIAALQDVKKGQAYLSGIKNAASQPLEFGANLITEPVDTISGIPKGVATLFGNVKTSLTSQPSKGEDSKMAQVLAMSANKRELASKLGVDVYSTNKVLQKELNGLAWATSLGSLTVTAALAPVGGAAAGAVSLTRTAQQLNNLVNQYPPQRLRQINEEKLLAVGMPPDVTSGFLDHPSYTPTQTTSIVSSLETLIGTKGRDAFLRQALTAEDEESANFFMYAAETLGGYQAKVALIQDISVFGPLVFAKASNGVVMVPLPLDYAIWTERASQRVPDAMRSYKAMNPNAKKFEFWLTGTASKTAKEEASKLGIQIVENVGNRIEFTY